MIRFTRDDTLMLRHTANVMQDRAADGNDYTDNDATVTDRIYRMGNSGQTLVITGDELDRQDTIQLYRDIVQAELNHWVPDASQRLLQRAGLALGVRHPLFVTGRSDCGAEPGWHALVADWVCGVYVYRCVTCGRLFKDGERG